MDGYTVNLPADLEPLFSRERELTAGAQGWLLLCRRLAEPRELVVVKMFQGAARVGGTDPREQFRHLSAQWVVQYVEPFFGHYGDRWWEVTEYCAGGTLREFADTQGGSLTPAQLRAVIAQLAGALDHLHGQQPSIIHRDIKPANLFLRSVDPLDVVIGDFGLAVVTQMSRERRSDSRTVAYAAPEAAGGEVAAALDWWSLGMSIAELAMGRHPYQRSDGLWLPDAQILSEVSSRPVPLDSITDDRLLLLLRGLLTRDPEQRWSGEQVRDWLYGGAPAVAQEEAAKPRAGIQPFPFAGRNYVDPAQLANAMSANWARAATVVVGADFIELLAWVDEFFPDLSLERIERKRQRTNQGVDRTVVEIIVRLNPSAEPRFAGEPVDVLALQALAQRMATDETIGPFVDKLFVSRALLAYSALPGSEDLAIVDSQWREMCDAAEKWLDSVRNAGQMTTELRALILRVAASQVASGGATANGN